MCVDSCFPRKNNEIGASGAGLLCRFAAHFAAQTAAHFRLLRVVTGEIRDVDNG